MEFMIGGDRVTLALADDADAAGSDGADAAIAPMPGVVVVIAVKAGDHIAKGAVVAIVEAMKMENKVLAPFSGVVREVRCRRQEIVTANQVLAVIARSGVSEAG
jgi:propionyl-CoA carboxylase alpha chain/3-methylcrotonyl-CoA carboxylase alpha subunit